MRDRTLPMKWVEEAAKEFGGDSARVREVLVKRGVSQQTIDDQMRRLQKHGYVGSVHDHAADDVAVHEQSSKPFLPVPKESGKKKT